MIFHCHLLIYIQRLTGQGCSLGLDVLVSIWSQDTPSSRLGLVSMKIVSISVLSWSQPLTSHA